MPFVGVILDETSERYFKVVPLIWFVNNVSPLVLVPIDSYFAQRRINLQYLAVNLGL
jgi:hypothetical protein